MLHKFKERFGTAGLIVAIFALVFAMVGGAYAAKGALSGSQKKEVEKIAKKFAGKDGAPGAQGSQGPAGAKGGQGEQGDKGDTGNQGIQGKQGDQGLQGAPGTPGAPGPKGDEGSPWTFNGVLPSEKTETGTWAFSGTEGEAYASISFPIPLESILTEEGVHFQSDANFTDFNGAEPGSVGCSTAETVAFKPTAPPGNLCVYYNTVGENSLVNASFTRFESPAFNGGSAAGRSGVALLFTIGTGTGHGGGAWAVTAPPPAP